MKSSAIVHCELTDGVTPDQRYGQEQLTTEVQEGDLFLFDLGYFSLKMLTEVGDAGGYFLSRLEPQTAIYLEDQRINLPAWLKKHKKQKLVEAEIMLGHKKLPCRFIAVRLPEKEKNQRLRKLRKQAKEKGKTLSRQRILLASWNLFVTNASNQKISSDKIHSFYRLRWSVELVFRQFKSLLKIHSSNHANLARLKCEIFGTMIVAAILSFSHNLLQEALWVKNCIECSVEKTFKFLANHAQLIFDIATKKIPNTNNATRTLMRKAESSCSTNYQPSRLSSLQRIQELA